MQIRKELNVTMTETGRKYSNYIFLNFIKISCGSHNHQTEI